MDQITVEPLDPRLPGVLTVHIPFEPTAFGATHHMLDAEITERLGLPDLASLSITARETFRTNGIWGPIVSDSDRYFPVTTGAFLAVIARPGSGTAATIEIKPVLGLFVPAGYAVGLQTVFGSRSSHLVVTKRCATGVEISRTTAEFVGQWRSTESDPACHESDPRLTHPSQS